MEIHHVFIIAFSIAITLILLTIYLPKKERPTEAKSEKPPAREETEYFLIPEIPELGEFCFASYSNELIGGITIPYWKDYRINSDQEDDCFELYIESDDAKVTEEQVKAYKDLSNFSDRDWQNIVTLIFDYCQEYFSDNELFLEETEIKSKEDLKNNLELTSVILHKIGSIGLCYECTWDEEHGVGVRIFEKEIEVGQISDALY